MRFKRLRGVGIVVAFYPFAWALRIVDEDNNTIWHVGPFYIGLSGPT